MTGRTDASTPGPDASTPGFPPVGVFLDALPNGGWQLIRNGVPYVIRGAGGDQNLALLRETAGNSIRTWGADETTSALLDEAHALGLSVTVGLWMGHASEGFDYRDDNAVAAQLQRHREIVRSLKDHPALLMWGVGNEMELDNDIPEMWRAVEAVAAMIKQVDPLHPTVTVTAELGQAYDQRLRDFCPSIDVWGINAYGGIGSVAQRLTDRGWTRPYVVTEFGPEGTWGMPTAPWGAPLELPTADKGAAYAAAWGHVAGDPRSIGGYAFVWTNAVSPTQTWFPLFRHDGTPIATIDALHEAWTGSPPRNLGPVVTGINSPAFATTVAPGERLSANLLASDPEGEPLRTTWFIARDSEEVGAFWRPAATCEEISVGSDTVSVEFDAPASPGPWRLFGVAVDSGQKAGLATLPFFVEGPEPDGAPLPFFVADTYAASGWMGHGQGMSLDTCEHPTAGACGGPCQTISWVPGGEGWVGIAWQYPAGNWGAAPGLAIDSSATEIEFVAWADRDGIRVSIFAGFEADGFNVTEAFVLGPQPRTYVLPLPDASFASVAGAFGFTMGTPADGRPVTINFAGVQWK